MTRGERFVRWLDESPRSDDAALILLLAVAASVGYVVGRLR